MPAIGGRANHNMTAAAYVQSLSEDLCAVQAAAVKAALKKKSAQPIRHLSQ